MATFYNVMLYGGLALAVIFAAIAIIIFVKLKIPKVIGDLTGSTARKRIQEIKEKGYESVQGVGASKQEAIKAKSDTSRISARDIQSAKTDPAEEATDILLEDRHEEATDVLNAGYDEEATDVLNADYDEEATDVLNAGYDEEATDVLNAGYDEEATDVLNAGYDEEATDVLSADDDIEATDILSGDSEAAGYQSTHVRSLYDVVVVHTEERI